MVLALLALLVLPVTPVIAGPGDAGTGIDVRVVVLVVVEGLLEACKALW